MLVWALLLAPWAHADGGFFAPDVTVALSADQRAIIATDGTSHSLTLSTGYTGNGDEFAWIVPTPGLPEVRGITETDERVFDLVDEWTAPTARLGGGCFVAGTEVLTELGPKLIESLRGGDRVYGYVARAGQWVVATVETLEVQPFAGEIVTIQAGGTAVHATENHPFYVLEGRKLSSRPFPTDVPPEHYGGAAGGRWVEAADLQEGDLLLARGDTQVRVTEIESIHAQTAVYNLRVLGCHTYTVTDVGIVVHNKGGAEEAGLTYGIGESQPVEVHGTVTLDHYQAHILGAENSQDLLEWLTSNAYNVDATSEEVLQQYIEDGWFFVAVKLVPRERRRYENEFLPPLTIEYDFGQIVFPLRISSVSATGTTRLSLYIVAPSTIYSTNFRTRRLRYNPNKLRSSRDSRAYVEGRIRRVIGDQPHTLVVLSNAEVTQSRRSSLFGLGKMLEGGAHVTRFEAALHPENLTEDLYLALHRRPRKFRVHVLGSEFQDTIEVWGNLVLLFGVVVRILLGAISAIAMIVTFVAGSSLRWSVRLRHFAGLATFMGPLLGWVNRNEAPPEIKADLRNILNFRLTVTVAIVSALLLTLAIDAAWIVVALLICADMVIVVVATIRANGVRTMDYRVAMPFIRRRPEG